MVHGHSVQTKAIGCHEHASVQRGNAGNAPLSELARGEGNVGRSLPCPPWPRSNHDESTITLPFFFAVPHHVVVILHKAVSKASELLGVPCRRLKYAPGHPHLLTGRDTLANPPCVVVKDDTKGHPLEIKVRS